MNRVGIHTGKLEPIRLSLVLHGFMGKLGILYSTWRDLKLLSRAGTNKEWVNENNKAKRKFGVVLMTSFNRCLRSIL